MADPQQPDSRSGQMTRAVWEEAEVARRTATLTDRTFLLRVHMAVWKEFAGTVPHPVRFHWYMVRRALYWAAWPWATCSTYALDVLDSYQQRRQP